MRLGWLSVFRHFRMDDFPEWIRIQRHTAIIAIFRLETAGVTTYFGYARALQQRNDLLYRTIRAFEFGRFFRCINFSVFPSVERPDDAIDHVIAAAARKADPIFIHALLAEPCNDGA